MIERIIAYTKMKSNEFQMSLSAKKAIFPPRPRCAAASADENCDTEPRLLRFFLNA